MNCQRTHPQRSLSVFLFYAEIKSDHIIVGKAFSCHSHFCSVTAMKDSTLVEKFAVFGQIGYLAFKFLDGKLIRRDAVKVIQIKRPDQNT